MAVAVLVSAASSAFRINKVCAASHAPCHTNRPGGGRPLPASDRCIGKRFRKTALAYDSSCFDRPSAHPLALYPPRGGGGDGHLAQNKA